MKTFLKLSVFVFGFFLHASFVSAAQLPPTQPGSLIEKVVCRANSEQSYALYLPTKYSAERKWPILYAFDPGARGQFPVERFQKAAELYGWIVVGSNNSKNGPNKLAVDAFEAMWQDTHERFAIDNRRVYATGFSGGARASVGLAARCEDCITGVIASGAGFHPEVAVSRKLPFIYFAAVGTEDYNFPELKELESKLVQAGATQRLEVFSGGHEWLPAEVATEAIFWMEIQAMKAGSREKDALFIESNWRAHLSAAQMAEDGGRKLEAYRRYQAIEVDFSGLRDVSPASQRAAQMKEDREVKKSLSEEKNEIKKQRELENQLTGLLAQRDIPENRLAATADFRSVINNLRKQSKEAQDDSRRRVARRVIRSLFAGAYEESERRQRAGNYTGAVSQLEILTEIAPDNPRLYFELSCAYARAGQKGRALETLQKAVEKGFSDVDSILSTQALDSVRGEAVYIELVKGLQKRP